jgi:predicted adenylyl cyclase CyaB
MALEIECKVRIDQNKVHDLFETIGTYMKGVLLNTVDKKDAYYSYSNYSHNRLRIRKVGKDVIITRKVMEARSDGIEVNQEIEFTALNQPTIAPFFESLGYSLAIEKEKHGWSWIKKNLTIELVEVLPLGWFIEIELLIDKNEEKEKAVKKLGQIRI